MSADGRILLTGATGYVGGRLLGVLERGGRRVRCLARRPGVLAERAGGQTEVVRGDVLDRSSLAAALEGVEAAYYLVHSMGASDAFEQRDREAALNFAEAARDAGLERIVYLGALGDGKTELSPHLRSRQEVGEILRSTGVPVVELRASIVIGAGSLSFEMVRCLVERLPVMVTPRWVSTMAQPVAVDDLLSYLVGSLELELDGSVILEIGGPDRVRYLDIMREYARQRGLRRLMVRVPVLTPRLSSLWLALVTPLQARVGRKLIDSIRNPTVVRDDAAARAFPDIRPVGIGDAIRRALGSEPCHRQLVDRRSVRVEVPPEQAFLPIRRIGGRRGWYFATWLWRLRGLLDRLAGGVGMGRGRRDPEALAEGDVLDCWRVEAVEEPRLLRLSAEMKLPGRGWLQFEVSPDGPGSVIHQTAVFEPAGVAGYAYWYLILPLHLIVFSGMLRAIAARARRALALAAGARNV